MTSKLRLDSAKVDAARQSAAQIADQVTAFVRTRTTVAVERTVLRLFGVDGIDPEGAPLPNLVVEQVQRAQRLGSGVTMPLCNAMLTLDLTAQQVAEAVAAGELDITAIPVTDEARVRAFAEGLAAGAVERIRETRRTRDRLSAGKATHPDPLFYVIVATGNIFEDAVQGVAAATQGADVIAVIRSTGQSLLDFVPYGTTTEGFGGTYATQANFRVMREALDAVGEKLGRYVMLTNYCSGLCMPEIAAMGAIERLDMMLNDALYGILFRDINMERTLVDQYFSRMINALAGVIINTGEDNYLTTDDAIHATHTVLASQLINEQLGFRCGLTPAQLGLGHAFEMDPMATNGFLMELAQAQLVREVFAEHRLKYMPPTRYMTGNIFRGYVQDAMFNVVTTWTRQGIQLLGMHTEAMHTPHIHDRHMALESARYITNNARDLGDEVEFKVGGLIERRAHETLDRTVTLLDEVRQIGLFEALSRGMFADVKRRPDGGRGLSGVAHRESDYFNPLESALREALALAD
jgi:beta-lysine 5,6-aminomutase alpha subunit